MASPFRFQYGLGQDPAEGGRASQVRSSRAESEDQRRKMAELYAAKRAATKQDLGRLGTEGREATMRSGDDAARGMATGMSVGGPWGALIGAVAGGAKGSARALRQRWKENDVKGKEWGEGKGKAALSAIGRTMFDFKGQTPSTAALTGATQVGGPALAGYKARSEGQGIKKAEPVGGPDSGYQTGGFSYTNPSYKMRDDQYSGEYENPASQSRPGYAKPKAKLGYR